ncbi:MAG: methyl-accepting chemotaxis protein [Holophaga sp.]|nr:methyl-accepting chemotaxis protein [Holophaga sp.]
MSHRLGTLVLAAVAGILVLGASSLWLLRVHLVAAEQRRITDVVDSTTATLDYFHNLEVSGRLSQAEAQKEAVALLRKTRFEGGKNFIFMSEPDGILLLSPMMPQGEGKNMLGKKTPDGVLVWDEMDAVIKSGVARIIPYKWPRTAGAAPSQKISYVRSYDPWHWAVGAGIYLTAVDEVYASGLKWTLVIAVVILAVITAMSRKIVRSVEDQLGGEPAYAVSITKAIAGGDLAVAVERKGGEASLLASMNAMKEQLRAVLGKVRSNAAQAASGSTELSATARQMAATTRSLDDSANQQQSSAQSMAAGMTELSASITEVTANVRKVERRVESVVSLTQKGEEAEASARSAMEAIRQSTDLMVKAIQVIGEIARQTNLLSLNAAIEAAKAGHMGKGFAVVAEEVRKLAERSSASAKEIGSLIEQSNASVQAGTQSYQASGQALNNIAAEIRAISSMVIEIGVAAEEQARTGNEVTQRVEEGAAGASRIATATHELATVVEEVARTAHELAQVADSLSTASARFRL